MRSWIDKNGSRYGWRKVEAPSEWWHVNYVGGYSAPPNPLRHLGKKQRAHAEKLLYHRRETNREAASGKGPRYRKHRKWRDHYRGIVAGDMKRAKGREKKILRRVLKDRDGRL